jgi:hypothetical protein
MLDIKGPSLQHPLGGYLSRPRFSWLAAVAADAAAAALQDQYSNMLIYWRPDLGLYRAVITEAVPANTPFDPPFINPTLTPIGGFIKPASDANNKQTGQLMAGIHLAPAEVATGLCQMFGATIMDASQFGWVLGFKNVSGVITPIIGDNATGLTNQLQVCSSERCLADACLLGLSLHSHAAT